MDALHLTIASTLALILALALPALLGGLWLGALTPAGLPGRSAVVWGCGTLLGLMTVPQVMRLLDTLGLGLSYNSTALAIAGMTAPALLLRGIVRQPATPAPIPQQTATRVERALISLLAVLILVRFIGLGIEVYWRPLFPWDATMHWATKARVWFEHRTLVPFVDYQTWLETAGAGVYTDRHPGYPAMIPLLQVWMNLAIDRWDESLMNLPWLLCLVALGLAFFGQLRLAGVSTTVATASTYLLLSMPLINIHVALAGYADLFLGAAYACAVMSLHNWLHSRQAWLAVLAVLFSLMCPFIKNEGFIWALSMIPATTIAFMQRRQAAKLFLLMLLWGVFFLLILPDNWEVAGTTVADIHPSFNMAALLGIIKSLWLHDNWHLLGFFLLLLIPLGLLLPGALTRSYLGVTVALVCSGGAYLFLFIFTGFGVGAADFAAVGRLSIHLVPTVLFLCTLIYHELLQRDAGWRRARQQPGHP